MTGVEDAARLDQQQLDFLCRERLVLDPSGNDEQFAMSQQDCAVPEIDVFFSSSRRRHTIFTCDWSSDVCSSDLADAQVAVGQADAPGSSSLRAPLVEGPAADVQIGRASCRKECRSRWSPYH